MIISLATDRFRCWGFIFYPDSCPKDWIDIIKSWHVDIVVSPLHEPDSVLSLYEPEEVLYKPHYHAALIFDGVKSNAQISELIKPLNGTIPFTLYSASGYIRYLIHYDDPDKPQYSKDDLFLFGNIIDSVQQAFDIGEYDTIKIIQQINDYIITTKCKEFSDLYIEACNHVKWRYVLDKFACKSVHALINSMRYK